MRRAYCVMLRACSHLKARRGAFIVGLALLSMASAPRPAWGQLGWYNYPYNTTISVTSAGNVGIGTSTPFSVLHVKSSGSAAYITLANSVAGKYWYQGFQDNGAFSISYSPDLISFPTRLTIDTGGNVGIGTASPQYLLSVNGNIGAKDVLVTNTIGAD